jgi:hypothetical protein
MKIWLLRLKNRRSFFIYNKKCFIHRSLLLIHSADRLSTCYSHLTVNNHKILSIKTKIFISNHKI